MAVCKRHFNPRSPYGERPGTTARQAMAERRFQSTLPLRGATRTLILIASIFCISIHAPLTGSDPRIPYRGDSQHGFQSTLPLRGATSLACQRRIKIVISIHAPLTGSDGIGHDILVPSKISIHAPLTGSDFDQCASRHCHFHFNPRSPYGERLLRQSQHSIVADFNPRSPYGERQSGQSRDPAGLRFQSTLPLRGATKKF